MNRIKTVSFLGSGNVATNLAKAFYKKGIVVEYIYSNTLENATLLAQKINAKPINQLEEMTFDSDLIVVALKDDIIVDVLKRTDNISGLIVHTSGSFDTANLESFSKRYGCIYPFQTFRKEIETKLEEIHFFIEANTNEDQEVIKTTAKLFSEQVVEMTSSERKSLHIAGVGLNNFTHYLLSITKHYCEESNLKPEYLTNLLMQTVNNSFYVDGALNMQTGPARRGDVAIIKEHIDQLENSPKYQRIYKTFSQLILDEFHENQFKL
ncbi:MAG: F420-dependent NADP oxidoreductase [Flavobacteriales bacterium]|jgi:predicted short-subunit dehydrogenase-like oxidoreductase (DUF2520 family)|nr:F420-dependent NADP oxidoreductase [Flavobacteriales bacterium]